MTPDNAYKRFDLSKFVKRLESLEMHQMWDYIDKEISAIEGISISQPTTPEGRDAAYTKQEYRSALIWFASIIGASGNGARPNDAVYFYPLLRKLVELGNLNPSVLDEIK